MKAGWESGWRDSLRLRLLLATAVAVGLAVAVAGWGLQSLFQRHVMQQLEATLTQQLELLIGQLEFDEQGRPMIDPERDGKRRFGPVGALAALLLVLAVVFAPWALATIPFR